MTSVKSNLGRLLCAAFMLFLISVIPATPALSAQSEGIAAVVNDDAVSVSDLQDRMKMVMASSGLPDTAEIRERLRPQIINALIEEQLMIQEATRLDIDIKDEDITQGFAQIARQNKMSPEEFGTLLQRQGIRRKTLEDQIRAQLSWSGVIQQELRPKIEVTDIEVDSTLDRLSDKIGKTTYLVSEIFLPVEDPRDEDNVKQLANRLTGELVQGGVPFAQIAGQFSQSAGASRGGDLGWIQQGQLAEELDSMLVRMNEGEISRPIRSLAGYHILYLRKKDILTADSMPSRDDLMNQLGMERLDRMQRRLLLDLKAAAFIERRV